jgi:hypothetical protein
MNQFNAKMVGLYTGVIIGGFHAIWAILVAIGWAQGPLDWIFGLHMILPVYTVAEFRLTTALFLVIFTFVVGYVVGYLATVLWNRMAK